MPRKGADAAAAHRRLDAARLRAEGKSFRQIAAALSVSLRQAFLDVRAGLKALHERLGERVEELSALELERLELPVAGLAPAVEAGDPQSVDAWRRLSESRRKLLGLDAPEKHEHTGADGSPLLPPSWEQLMGLPRDELLRMFDERRRLNGHAPAP